MKINKIAAGFLLLAGFTTAAFAEEVKGTVKSIDNSKSEIIVNDSISGTDKIVAVHPKVLTGLKEGASVKASLKVGTNQAETISVEV